MRKNITVIADFDFLECAEQIGTLTIDSLSGRGNRFSFSFSSEWCQHHPDLILDPDTSNTVKSFSNHPDMPFIVDAMPDRWGRTLIERRKTRKELADGLKPRKCTDMDYLLGTDDFTRKGAIRFADENMNFLSEDTTVVPPVSRLGDYMDMIADYEKHGADCTWLDDFFSASSSLGGARPKINVIDNENSLWIAKVPSLSDQYDAGAWEQVAMLLARDAGIDTPEAMLLTHDGGRHTFLSKRFDRKKYQRIHMASALCLLGRKTSNDSSFIDIAEAIAQYSVNPAEDLKQLFRRLVFSAAINNTDNHLRNHSFLLSQKGWRLSPAYDMNPSVHGRTSVLAIDEGVFSFSFDVIKSTAPYYDISEKEADTIINEIIEAVSKWRIYAGQLGLRAEIPMMESAFSLSL